MKQKKLLTILALLLMAATGAWAQTTVNGLFTVNADGDKVQFASGNLRYTSGAWSFFDHQYDYYAEYSAASWDKFGWSTSGTTYGKSTSTNENLYKGDFVDWGNAVGTGWRTLSNDEWAYVVNTRSASTVGGTANGRYAKAKVNDVMGVILFPDTYTHPDGVTAPTGVNAEDAAGWNGNSYTAADWTKMESAGCVFLPAAGGRYNSSNPTLVVNVGNEGCYWSSTSDNSTANFLNFKGYTFYPSNTDSPRSGYSVRLVKSVTTYAVSLKAETADGANWTISPAKAAEGSPVTATYSGDRKVKSVKAVKKAAVTYTLLSAATTDDIGKVVCAAGHLHDAKTAVPDGCTAVGILGKVTETGHGLILALQDAAQQSWNTINGWTSASYAGTTLKVLPDDAARGANLTSYTTLGETAVSNWAVAQKSDYDAIFTNLGSTTGDTDGKTFDDNVNAYITTGVGGTAIDGHYRSATEKEGGSAWGFAKSFWSGYEVQFDYSVRPVLGF